MRVRQVKDDDQEKIEKGCNLLFELIKNNQKEIEPALWISAMICILAENFARCGMPFENFKDEMKKCVEHYKY